MAESPQPAVWVLQGTRKGDNMQAQELARRLGWPYQLHQVRFSGLRIVPNHLLGASLASLRKDKSFTLTPPWPDLVIAVGRRTVPVARWIRKQSGGRTRLVHLGRPRAPLWWFDLVITTPQYGLPSAANVIELPLPFALAITSREEDLTKWRQTFGSLPRPWTGVLVGGSRYPARFGRSEAAALARQLLDRQGSSLISTSPRTDPLVVTLLRETLGNRAYVHQWQEGVDNPHHAVLSLADSLVVTSDSISMIAEAAATAKPLQVFEAGHHPLAFSWQAKQGLGAWLARTGILSPPRSPEKIRVADAEGAYEAAVARIRLLLAS
jgi:hypothetical protein